MLDVDEKLSRLCRSVARSSASLAPSTASWRARFAFSFLFVSDFKLTVHVQLGLAGKGELEELAIDSVYEAIVSGFVETYTAGVDT